MSHINIILTEMFKRVGEEYDPIKTIGENWFWKHEWEEEEQNNFRDWLAEYLFKNRQARKEIMAFPIRRKKNCHNVANFFILNYGWKVKSENSLKEK